jgi:hypothetical protein
MPVFSWVRPGFQHHPKNKSQIAATLHRIQQNCKLNKYFSTALADRMEQRLHKKARLPQSFLAFLQPYL